MSISQHLKSSLLSFSGKRVGYVLLAVSFGRTPVHFYVSCEVSSAIAGQTYSLWVAGR